MQNQKFEVQLQAVKERLDQARGRCRWFHSIPQLGLTHCAFLSPEGRVGFAIELWPDREATSRWRRGRRGCDEHRRDVPQHGKPPGEAAERGFWVRLWAFRNAVVRCSLTDD